MAAPRNEAEEAALEKFVANTQFDGMCKGVLMRYLRARDLDLKRAEEAIKASIEWKCNHIEKSSFGWKYPQEFLDTFRVYFTGFDAEGRVVLYIKFDDWLPLRSLFETYTPMEILTFSFHVLSDLHKKMASSKHQQLIGIWDNSTVGFAKVFHEVQNWIELQTLRELIQMVDMNFPETLYKAFFINTARAAVWGFSLVKPFMRPYTLAKILIHGSDESSWLPVLREHLSDDLIPSCLGGEAELGKSLYDHIGIVGCNNVEPIQEQDR